MARSSNLLQRAKMKVSKKKFFLALSLIENLKTDKLIDDYDNDYTVTAAGH